MRSVHTGREYGAGGGAADILVESAATNQYTRGSYVCTMSTVIPRHGSNAGAKKKKPILHKYIMPALFSIASCIVT